MPHSHIINSKDRTLVSASSCYFTVPINPPVLNPKKVTLKWLSMPNTFYNVRQGINNSIAFTDGTGAHTAIIPPGAYSIDNLLARVSSIMTSIGSQTYAAAYDTNTFKVSISASTPFTIEFNMPYSCADLLGFSPVATLPSVLHTGNKGVRLNIDFIQILISELSNTIYSTDGSQCGFMIPVTENSGDYIQYTEEGQFAQSIEINSGNNIFNLTVDLHLKNYERADLNGSEWSFMLEFE